MRASRLLNILTILQARRRVTAQALASECEVSIRTIYRDIDALSSAGIPVFGEKGIDGGYQLLDGYRVRLNGLSPREAEALFMAGLSGPAADLGLGAVMSVAESKLLAALPEDLRQSAGRVRARFHLDAPAWFERPEEVKFLPQITDAVWRQKSIVMRYRSWKGERERRADPLGIVLKAGIWYLVARVEDSVRTYRIARILELTLSDDGFERPMDFDLAGYWAQATDRLEADLHNRIAKVRLSPVGATMIAKTAVPYMSERLQFETGPDDKGWRTATLPVGSDREALTDFLRLGAEVEVIEPHDLRDQLAAIAHNMAQLYARSLTAGPE